MTACPYCGAPETPLWVTPWTPTAHRATCPRHPAHREDRGSNDLAGAAFAERRRALAAGDYDDPEPSP